MTRVRRGVARSATGSGDTTANWLATFTWLVAAALVAAVWSVADRRRANYARLFGWLLLVLRLSLATSLLLYGMVKMLPSQMAFQLHLLIEPFGDMSPMGVLWAQIAVSQPYEIALGLAEVTAAVLLFVPVTATVGALPALVSRSDHTRPASAIASERLRRVVFDNPVSVTVQRMDDSLVTLPGTVDVGASTVTLTQDAAGRWKFGTFTYQQPDAATLILDGQLGGRPVRLRMELVEKDSFPLIARGFHWVQEAPYRR
ncbi:hypothetical protein [Nocardia amamiensis]|uniref:hypothetical protein n=1 Tax=Nocardia amamiensis TaxID=404578 RepID=UPI003410D6B0